MKVVHLCLANFFHDHYSYQENILPKFHYKSGYSVEVIASLLTFNQNGQLQLYEGPSHYYNEYGIPITRLPYKKPNAVYSILRRYQGVSSALESANPDVLFIHGCQFLDMQKIVSYLKKHSHVRVYVDNHADFHNSAQNWLSRNILHKVLWRHCAHIIEPYTRQFYGVLPARVDFLKEVYRLPPSKCKLLVMGADDDCVKPALDPNVRTEQRKRYGIQEKEVLILTGGKIDHNKPQILLLMQAINQLANKNIRLAVFGSVDAAFQTAFDHELSEYVQYIGWKKTNEIYNDFAAADLIAFPGLHSVLWEQAVGMGKPCLFRRMKGFEHIDLDGNCLFFQEDTLDSYVETIENAIACIPEMKNAAEERGIKNFSYRRIAAESIEG